MKIKLGKVHVNTGDGHGKTTTSLGVAMRAIGHGYKVCMIQFLKGRKNIGEYLIQKRLMPNFVLYQFGSKNFIVNNKNKKKDTNNVLKGLEFADNIMKKKLYNIIILDEINVAVDLNLINEQTLLNFIENHRNKGVEIILTGRNAKEKIIEVADIVTDMKKVKHYYDQGVAARKGVEY